MAVCLLGVTALQAQVGQTFPDLKAETAEGKTLQLPAAAKGKFTLLGLASSTRSEKALQSWFEPVYTRFMDDRSNAGLFADFAYDVNVYFVPMFTGANKVAAGPARKKMLKEVDADLHKHVLFYVGELGLYENQLGMTNKDEPYFFVLDESGKIVYATRGAYSEKKMEQVEDILSEDDW
ncbi:hypothetical protein D770_19215 [Flammeovirgaceae bacterium 311]|nr:hypothetical protein D770_19215 [Flammeovirgaceae bacterium 311]